MQSPPDNLRSSVTTIEHWPGRKHLSKGRSALYQKVDREFLPIPTANLYLLVDEMLAILLLWLGVFGKVVRYRNTEVAT
jgi:hypothetical protein